MSKKINVLDPVILKTIRQVLGLKSWEALHDRLMAVDVIASSQSLRRWSMGKSAIPLVEWQHISTGLEKLLIRNLKRPTPLKIKTKEDES